MQYNKIIHQTFWLIKMEVISCNLILKIEVSNNRSSLKKFYGISKSLQPANMSNIFAKIFLDSKSKNEVISSS